MGLYPQPDPSGSEVAVEVSPVSGSGHAGIVVLNRAGRVLGVVPALTGADSGLSWSPSGSALAFTVARGGGAVLNTGPPAARSGP